MWVNVLLVAAITAMAAYLFWVSYLIKGKSALPTSTATVPSSISIILCSRNDGNQLVHLITTLQQQIRRSQHVEIIAVDDGNEPPLTSLLAHFEGGIKVLDSNGNGKKEALTTGIQHAKNEWIITLDVDVSLPASWWENIQPYLSNAVDLCILPIEIQKEKGALFFFQWLEFHILQIITRGSAHRKTPLLCNGAHLAFRKQTWMVSYFPVIQNNLASGDDQFLLESFRMDGKKIVFLDNPELMVTTTPVGSWRQLFSQRRRWSSKTTRYRLWDMQGLGWITLLSNLGWICTLSLFILDENRNILILLLLLYISIECIWVMDTFKKQPFSTLLFLLFYPFYVLATLGSFLLYTTEWKGRKIRV